MFRPRSIALLLFLPIFPMLLSAQTSRISGSVVRVDGAPLGGAHIQVIGTQFGAVADRDGRFHLRVASRGEITLRATHLGFLPALTKVHAEADGEAEVRITLEESPVDLGAVTVSATRSQELLRNIPQPLTVVDATEMERFAPVSVPDALDATPGITLVRDGVWGTDVSIRGLSRANVVTLVDGTRIETATNHAAGLSMIDVSDIDRIEVIRGAASTLYGTGATGGVVNVVTRDGQFGDGFRMRGSLASSYSSVNDGSMGSLGIDAEDDTWFLHVRGTMRAARDAQTPDGILRDSRFHDRGISAGAGVRLPAGGELRARYQLFDAQDVGIPGGASFPAQASARYPDERREMVQGEWRMNGVSDALERLSLRVTHQRIDRNVELIPSPAAVLRPSAEHTMNAALLQGNWSFGAHHLVAGADAWQREYDGRRLREVRANGMVIADLPLPRARFRSLGLFAQDEWALPGDRLRLTLGARADQIHVENDEAYDLLYIESNGIRNDAPANRTLRWTAQQSDEVSWSAHAGVLFRLLPQLDATLNVSRSYRAPSLEERFQYIELGGATYLGDVGLAAEKGSVADLGLRLHADRVTVRVNAFVNAMHDLVVDERRSDTLYVKTNVGTALLQGGELVVEYNPFSSLVLYGSASYVRGRDTETDADLPQMPPLSGRIGLRVPVSGFFSADLALDAAADQDAVAPGEDRTPGYAIMHVRLQSRTFHFAGLDAALSAGVENVFDRAWRRHLSTLRGIVAAEPGRNMFFRLQLLF